MAPRSGGVPGAASPEPEGAPGTSACLGQPRSGRWQPPGAGGAALADHVYTGAAQHTPVAAHCLAARLPSNMSLSPTHGAQQQQQRGRPAARLARCLPRHTQHDPRPPPSAGYLCVRSVLVASPLG